MSQIFLYKRSIKLSKANIKRLEAEGYIAIPVESLSDAQVVSTFPDVDNTWLLSTAMDLIMTGKETEFRKDIGAELGRKVVEFLRKSIPELKDNG